MKSLTPREKKEYERDHTIVRGIFKNLESPGSSTTFPFRKWPGDKLEMITLKHDEEREVPYMVARHLNENCIVEEDQSYILGPNGLPQLSGIKRYRQRFAFLSTSFKDFDLEREKVKLEKEK